MTSVVFEHANVFDGAAVELTENQHVLVEGGRIREISDRPIRSQAAERLDVRGMTLMPGLIDAHVHVTDWGSSPAQLPHQSASLTTLHAARNLKRMLMRGFTSVRDACGADFGLAAALEQGLIEGPRLFFVGKALSPTGGHGDFRLPGDDRRRDPCGCEGRGLSVVVDGEAEVRRAARNELRKGAHAVKIMASGGVASPADPISNLQFSESEIRAAVEEASFRGAYVMAHAYTAESISRCVEFGVRSIEHANLIDLEAARATKLNDAYVVPTLVTYAAMRERGSEIGLPDYSLPKLEEVAAAGLQSLEYLESAGVKTGLGTDLFGALEDEQSRELLIRAEVNSPVDVLRSAMSVNAELLRMSGELGCVKPGAHADLLVVVGNPLNDLGLLQEEGRHLPYIMKGGRLVKRPPR